MNVLRHRGCVCVLAGVVGLIGACSDQDGTATLIEVQKTNTNEEVQIDTEQADDDPFKRVELELPEAEPVIGFINSRTVQSLNGEWRAIVDPMGVGNPNPLSPGFFKDAQNVSGMELIEYDFDTAFTLRVPGDWNSQYERLFFYRGQVWYRTKFTASPSKSELYHLHFGAANFHAQVFLNGDTIGQHLGGYVPFSFDVTKQLKDGENTLVVRVDNTLDESTIPTARTDWWPYGGLTRDVSLVSTPKAFIRNAKIELTDRETGEVAIQLFTQGHREGAKAVVEIAELGVQRELEIDSEGLAKGSFSAQMELWSPENPKLYEVRFSVGADEVRDKVGFRTIETNGTQILLNGEPVKFRGISTHEEPIGSSGVAYSRDHVTGLLEEAKGLNANFVRAAHYPYSRYMAEIADELGLLLWEEIPVYWSIDWDNEETLSIARDQMERLIERDWNRASVVIWSVANETPSSPARLEFLRNLIEHTRSMDQSRLVSAALLGGSRKSFEEIVTHLSVRGLELDQISLKDRAIMSAIKLRAGLNAPQPDETYTVVIDDPLGDLVDIVSYNEYFGWYYSKIFARETNISEGLLRRLMLEFMPDMRIRASVEKPVHISEFGAGAKYGLSGGEALIWTEEYQAQVYRAQIAMLRQSPQIQGMTPWILKDFRAMLRPRGGIQDYYNRKGLIDENGNKKIAHGVLQEFYSGSWD